MTFLPSDKIRVFVSSRLGECEAERAAARDVVVSLGHQPVMFEAAGARPYAPRTVYLRGLEESQIFVGIYREGYGHIAEGMDISGLEDEYRHARSLGIPQLLYVLRGGVMEPKLKTLVDEFTSPEITVGYYTEANELGETIKTDLVALVSDYFRRGRLYVEPVVVDPGALAEALTPAAQRLLREEVEDQLGSRLDADPLALVIGPLGSGKTIFLSVLSKKRNWAFVECGEKALQDVLTDAANAVRLLLGLPGKIYLHPSAAQAALHDAWEASTTVTLVLDDMRDQQVFDTIRSVTPVSDSHRLVVSSREDIVTPGTIYEMPPLTLEEIRRFTDLNRDQELLAGELVELQSASKGNPLYLRYYLAGEPGAFANNLAEYEARVWRSLSAGSRELLSYLAWSNRSLSLEDLSELTAGSSILLEELADNLAAAGSLLMQSERGYSIFHPHAKETIRHLTARSKPKLQYYVGRLSKWFYDKRDFVSAFSTLEASEFEVSENLLEMAGRQAMVQGHFRTAITILEEQVRLSRESANRTRERDLVLVLAHTVSLSGNPDHALGLVDKAATMEVEDDPPIAISEVRDSIAALTKGDREAFERLKARKQEYCRDGELWNAARVSVELSAYHARQHEPEASADEAEFAMTVFRDNQDDYGYRIARGNYLSAISALPQRRNGIDDLVTEFGEDAENDSQQRALLCNVLGRLARERGDTEVAKSHALEAIEIGREIGDNSIVCNNLMNLGNSYRDEGEWSTAIHQYEAADKLAREAKLIVAEAAAQELLAAMFNKMGNGERALHHANYSVSIARGVSKRIEANATEELAQAYELIDRMDDAREAWLRYAECEMERTEDVKAGSYGFVRAACLMTIHHNTSAYIATYRRLFNLPPLKRKDLGLGEQLIEDLPKVLQHISVSWTFEATVYHCRPMFVDAPLAIARRVYLVAMRQLFDAGLSTGEAIKRFRIALALTMALPQDTLRLSDIVDVGELIARSVPNISFRAQSDGAAHWNLEVSFGKPTIISVVQIDDRSDVSLVALSLTLLLAAFSSDIFDDVLSGAAPEREWASIHVCNYGEARELFPLEKIGLESEPVGCAVTRATDVKIDEEAPILVITSESLTSEWLVGSGRANTGQRVFASVLAELVFHLQAGEIEVETLYPKIAQVVANTIS